MRRRQARPKYTERKKVLFASRKNIKMFDGYPFKLRYKGVDPESAKIVCDKHRQLGNEVRQVGNECWVEACRMGKVR